MKKIFKIIVVVISLWVLSSQAVGAQAPSCNSSCQVNEDCPHGYACYVGICRNRLCASSVDCSCSGITSSPIPSPNITIVQSTPAPTFSPVNMLPATHAATLKRTPKTGFSSSPLIVLSISMLMMGVGIRLQEIFLNNEKTAYDIGVQRKSKKTR